MIVVKIPKADYHCSHVNPEKIPRIVNELILMLVQSIAWSSICQKCFMFSKLLF